MKLKRFLLLLLFVIFGVVAFLLLNRDPENGSITKKDRRDDIEVITGLKTCEVCGYDALEALGDTCRECNLVLTQEEAEKEGVANIRSLLVLHQTTYFMPDSLGQPIEFLEPKVSTKGYPKNPNWRPTIYESDIFEFQKALEMFKAYEDSIKANGE